MFVVRLSRCLVHNIYIEEQYCTCCVRHKHREGRVKNLGSKKHEIRSSRTRCHFRHQIVIIFWPLTLLILLSSLRSSVPINYMLYPSIEEIILYSKLRVERKHEEMKRDVDSIRRCFTFGFDICSLKSEKCCVD